MYTPRQYTEIFHLLFLRHLENKLAKNLYALKGGCNLRFFFKSIRYSEDIDFDVNTVSKETLRSKVTKLLKSPPFEQMLHLKGMEIAHLSEAKQTETTQRWKLHLHVPGFTFPLPMKIEFSRRKAAGKTLFEPIDADLIRSYQLYPILANHYALDAAFSQKIEAILQRTETQARDIFDIKLLLDQGAMPETSLKKIKTKINRVIENINSVGFSEFKSQVIAYLMIDYQNYYDSKKSWNDIQSKVIDVLKKELK